VPALKDVVKTAHRSAAWQERTKERQCSNWARALLLLLLPLPLLIDWIALIG
jgi:hypothetical protein